MTIRLPKLKPYTNPFNQIAKTERGLSKLRKQRTPVLDNDPWTVAKFKYLPPGNYLTEINGHCYLVWTGRNPGRFVQKDGQNIGLWFPLNATPSEIKEALWADANGIRDWDQRAGGSEL